MGAELNFDANEVAPSTKPDPIPNGEYRMAIVASEVKTTSNGKGKYLKLELQVLEGEYRGRKAWDQLNIVNENAQAQQIAQGQLSAICHATGVMKLTNSAQLHDIPMLVRLVVTKDAGYDPKNDVKAYKAIDGGAPKQASSTAAAAAPTTPVTPPANAPAWARKAS